MNNKPADSHSLNKGIVVVSILAIFIAIFLLVNKKNLNTSNSVENNLQISSVVSEKDGIQYINMTARGGYSPKEIIAKANMNTVLRITTFNTFDCSSALVIPSLNYQSNLPPTGTTEIQIPPQGQNSIFSGSCSMGMYKFTIKFI